MTDLSCLQKHTVIVIGGPTASGKTAAAVQLAQKLRAEIISADSRQCYKELNIGVARPSLQELAEVPHHFIASHSIKEEVNAGVFEHYALQKITELAQKNAYTIVVGGTGLYLKALCEGLDELPKVDIQLRNKLISLYEANGLIWLQEQVKENDKLYWNEGEIQNPQRLLRALEIVKTTGKSIIEFQRKQPAKRPFSIVKLAIDLPREQLYNNINTRVLGMIEAGLVEEVQKLVTYKHLNALQTVGYKEVFDYLDGTISLSVCIAQIQQHTRNYAKRQVTWFKNQGAYKAISAKELNELF